MNLRFLVTVAIPLGLILLLATPSQFTRVYAEENLTANPPSSVEERRLLYLLGQERSRLEIEYRQRAKKLDLREIELKTLAGEVDKKLEDLQKLREHVQKLLAEKSSAEVKRVKNLSKMYAKMKPTKAALLINDLEEKLAVAILTGMPPKSGAKILNSLPVGRAKKLSTTYSSLDKS